eukprot:scaffold335_cov253-Pinguiococcus_pyrenoidosus.AAC.5
MKPPPHRIRPAVKEGRVSDKHVRAAEDRVDCGIARSSYLISDPGSVGTHLLGALRSYTNLSQRLKAWLVSPQRCSRVDHRLLTFVTAAISSESMSVTSCGDPVATTVAIVS